MSLREELGEGIEAILTSEWDVRQGRVVPDPEDVTLRAGGVEIDGTVLFSDLAESTLLTTEFERKVAAKVFKAFHLSCTKIIAAHEGALTGWDGDRVMGVFMGESKNANAVTAAFKINSIVKHLLSPILRAYFKSLRQAGFQIVQGTGIDTGRILAVRAGQRNSNDLVWVSKATSFAARLSEIRQEPYRTFISKEVYTNLPMRLQFARSPVSRVWRPRLYPWRGGNRLVYYSQCELEA